MINLIYSLPQIFEEFYHTINNADHNKDLKWWSNNYGVIKYDNKITDKRICCY